MANPLEPARSDSLIISSATPTLVSQASNSQRRAFYFKNTSTSAITIALGLGQPAVIGSGVNLAQGETYVEFLDVAFEPYQGTITALGDAAGGTLAIMER